MKRLKDKGFAHKHAMWPLDGAGHDLRPPIILRQDGEADRFGMEEVRQRNIYRLPIRDTYKKRPTSAEAGGSPSY